MAPRVLLVGSGNAAKLQAVRVAAAAVLPAAELLAVAVASGVAEQPVGWTETVAGAENRAVAALRGAEGWGVGIESGILRGRDDRLTVIGWCAVAAGEGILAGAASPAYALPSALSRKLLPLLEQGAALAEAAAVALGHDAARWGADGLIAQITGNRVDRVALWETPVTIALCTACREAGVPL